VGVLNRTRIAVATIGVAILMAQGAGLARAGESVVQSEIHAVFLVKFIRFVTWPPQAFASATAPIELAIIGEDDFGTALETAVRQTPASERTIRVKRVGVKDDLTKFHVLFIATSEERQIAEILDRLASVPVLAVSDAQRFCERGGVIGFVSENNRVRFEINVGAAEKRGLKLSTRLITLAAKVYANDR
jgi:hypothetical protein